MKILATICAFYKVKWWWWWWGGIEVDDIYMQCLLQRIFPDLASDSNVELLQRLLILSVREIEVIDVRKLDWRLAKREKSLENVFLE